MKNFHRDSRSGGDRGPKDFGKRSSGGHGFSKPRFEDKKLFEAVCANCGDDCLVPFRPFPGKPVFCKKCFDKDDRAVNRTVVKTDNSSNKNFEQLKSQIEMLNIKLDRVLRELTPKVDRE